MSLSIVIPTFNEAAKLPRTLVRLRAVWPTAEVIVADGGSIDGTDRLARSAGTRVVSVQPAGRGPQLRAGAEQATGDWLLFLHADTEIEATAASAVADYMARPDASAATFRVRYAGRPGWLLRKSAWFTRFDSVFTRFGDHGILIRRSAYQRIGGFPPWPLFEDVELLRRARQLRRIDRLPAAVITSSRRFAAQGTLRQQLRNAWLLLRFLAGADPHRLAREYPSADRLASLVHDESHSTRRSAAPVVPVGVVSPAAVLDAARRR